MRCALLLGIWGDGVAKDSSNINLASNAFCRNPFPGTARARAVNAPWLDFRGRDHLRLAVITLDYPAYRAMA
jgi:hypothetical protein